MVDKSGRRGNVLAVMKRLQRTALKHPSAGQDYANVLSGMITLVEHARRASVRAVNTIMTATYWEVGRRIVECDQGGEEKAEYGKQILPQLSVDLTKRFGRGFSVDNLENMRRFYLLYPSIVKSETAYRKSPEPGKSETLSRKSARRPRTVVDPELSGQSGSVDYVFSLVSQRFPLTWSHYVCLLSVDNPLAREFYENEALRGGWNVRQLDRQVSTLFYERTALSRDKAAMLAKGGRKMAGDTLTVEEEIKDPLFLEFLALRDEYSESDMEDAMIRHLEMFLLELGGDFTFVGRQKRLRIGNEWYRVDLVFYHRKLRCLVIVDLKLGKFSHSDVGQMHVYLNYARKHWTHSDENPPVGLILCSRGNEALARYALDSLPNKVLAAQYRLALPDEHLLAAEIERTRLAILARSKRKKTLGTRT